MGFFILRKGFYSENDFDEFRENEPSNTFLPERTEEVLDNEFSAVVNKVKMCMKEATLQEPDFALNYDDEFLELAAKKFNQMLEQECHFKHNTNTESVKISIKSYKISDYCLIIFKILSVSQ